MAAQYFHAVHELRDAMSFPGWAAETEMRTGPGAPS
jgi:hypothetical protein